jgi:gluconate 2-dehydrogenase gamma chain
MDRRDALRNLAVAAVGATVAPPWVGRLLALADAHAHRAQHLGSVEQAVKPWAPKVLTAHQDETVTAISELIIPATDTAGARAANVNRFIDAIIDDAHEAERREFLGGLDWMDARSRQLFGADFIGATPEQQAALLTIVSSERNTALADRAGIAFFTAIKGMTITGYYHSEIGMREELGNDGTMFFADDPGCVHPEHQKT